MINKSTYNPNIEIASYPIWNYHTDLLIVKLNNQNKGWQIPKVSAHKTHACNLF